MKNVDASDNEAIPNFVRGSDYQPKHVKAPSIKQG